MHGELFNDVRQFFFSFSSGISAQKQKEKLRRKSSRKENGEGIAKKREDEGERGRGRGRRGNGLARSVAEKDKSFETVSSVLKKRNGNRKIRYHFNSDDLFYSSHSLSLLSFPFQLNGGCLPSRSFLRSYR